MTQQELNTIIQSGEGYKIEFKRNVNSDLPRELVAFANSSGGRVFIGIEDNGEVRGVAIDNVLKSKVEMMARDCDPPISVYLGTYDNILIIEVPEGRNKPYRCTGGFYIRNGASTAKLSTNEIGDFFKTEGRVHFDEMLTSVPFPDGISDAAVRKYMERSGITGISSTRDLLSNLGVLQILEQPALTHAGVLFFTQSPAAIFPQSAVTCVAFKGNTKVDVIDKKTFEWDLITNIDEALTFLKRHLNIAFEITGRQRKEKLEIPEVVLREAVVNAVAHRDYFEKGAQVMIEVFDNRVEITNPGGLPKGLPVEDFGKRTLARNPLMAALLHRAGYIEKLGTGVPRIRQRMAEAGLPEPQFQFNQFFTVVLQRYSLKKELRRELDVNDKQGERLVFILRQLHANAFNGEGAAQELATSSRTIRNDLDLLIEKGWVQSQGTTRGRTYVLTQTGISKLEQYG